MTSRCTEPQPATPRYRTNPQLLMRRVAAGSLVCTPARSAYQDVRVLRLDELATRLVELADAPRTVDELFDELFGAMRPQPSVELEELIDGLAASRVIERIATSS